MVTDDYIDKIISWGKDRGIFDPEHGASAAAQMEKLGEEYLELFDAVKREDYVQIVDGIGDMLVVLIMVAKLKDLTLTECLAAAYEEIKDRRGHMKNGIFIKEADTSYQEDR